LDCATIAFSKQYIRRNGRRAFSEDVYVFCKCVQMFSANCKLQCEKTRGLKIRHQKKTKLVCGWMRIVGRPAVGWMEKEKMKERQSL